MSAYIIENALSELTKSHPINSQEDILQCFVGGSRAHCSPTPNDVDLIVILKDDDNLQEKLENHSTLKKMVNSGWIPECHHTNQNLLNSPINIVHFPSINTQVFMFTKRTFEEMVESYVPFAIESVFLNSEQWHPGGIDFDLRHLWRSQYQFPKHTDRSKKAIINNENYKLEFDPIKYFEAVHSVSMQHWNFALSAVFVYLRGLYGARNKPHFNDQRGLELSLKKALHAIRMVIFGEQLVLNGEVTNFDLLSSLRKEMLSYTENIPYEKFERRFIKVFEKQMGAFKSACYRNKSFLTEKFVHPRQTQISQKIHRKSKGNRLTKYQHDSFRPAIIGLLPESALSADPFLGLLLGMTEQLRIHFFSI